MSTNDDTLYAVALPLDNDVLETLADHFRQLKLDVQTITGGSLVVSGTRQQFSEAFDHAVVVDEQQHAWFLVEGKAVSELGNRQLPPPLAAYCRAIEFQRAPDFGPGASF